MSKKKKFAGKKTKLAQHALTQALVQEQSEAGNGAPYPPGGGTLAQAVQSLRQDQLPLQLPMGEDHTFFSTSQAAATKLYVSVLQELEDVREILRAAELPPRPRRFGQVHQSIPDQGIIAYSLQIVSHTLREIRTMMA